MRKPQLELLNGPLQRRTHCRICEPQCALLATVEGGEITKIEGNRQHVFSEGHLCVKAAAAADVIKDPDRVVTPLKRVGAPGQFEAVSWDEALDEIVERLGRVRQQYGNHAFASFMGNPPAFGMGVAFFLSGFQDAFQIKWRYGVNADDAAARQVANFFLYGSPAILLKPDLWRTKFVLMLGANPFVSHGSTFSEPKVREALHSVVERGGRVVVVDPRRSETARAFEHLPVRAGSDTWFLIGLIRTLQEEDLVAREFVRKHVSGAERMEALLQSFSVEECAIRSGVDAAVLRQLARDFAAAESGVVYGRTGTCTQRFGTLNNLLQDFVNALTGNIERPGGYVFGWAAVDLEKFAEAGGFATYSKQRTRVFGHPDVFGMLPSTSLVPDITTEGPGQVRALVTVGTNAVHSSAGGGKAMEDALEQLDLHFSLDLYVNETNKHAHFILPVTSFYEREDLPIAALGLMLRPALWWSPAVVPPRGEVREEWKILQEIARRSGLGGAYSVRALRWLARIGLHVTPSMIADLLVRTGPAGDWFGLKRGGYSLKKLREHHPDGVLLKHELPTRPLRQRLHTPDKRINVCPPILEDELNRLRGHLDDPAFPLRLIGMREIRSQNSWLHNIPRVMPSARRHVAHLNPIDATAHGITADDAITITSKSGSIRTAVKLTADIFPGTVALPHGWGHSGGWKIANRSGGVNSNILASGALEDIEPIAGMSILTGIPIRISRAAEMTESALLGANMPHESATS
ncbi:MAG: formate dehydrogenase [Hydrocarboniphaga sp.]|nr:molybdopterin-dependent oxidoreductase [Hydrocarboniphaga sp.]MDB5967872.1 formate dehydrogenase [Hydrocarboniphaga sp.]